ncbi:hypothetical protein V1511DRAFT_490142 [Dipodascopsis uninucleata]
MSARVRVQSNHFNDICKRYGVMLSTGNDIPGYDIVEYCGIASGMSVRSTSTLGSVRANFKSIVGGELTSMTESMTSTRNQAVERLVSEARDMGANAVYAFRFDCNSDSDGWIEICCYGTAVYARPLAKHKGV